MAKKQRKQQKEERELTRKEVRTRARDRARNRKLYLGTGVAIGLVVLVVLAGLIFEFAITPNTAVARVGDSTISTGEFRRRVLLTRSELFAQYEQLLQLEQQFGGQGFFTSQINQIEATLASPFTLGVQVVDQLINEEVIVQEAEARGITVSDEEIDTALREEVAAFQGLVTEPQATETAAAGAGATATAAASSPTPTPTVDASSNITATAAPPPTPTPRPVMGEADYEEGLQTLEDNLNEIANMSLTQYRDVIRARLLEEKLREQVTAEEVSETETQVRARHILLRPREPTPTPTELPEGAPTLVPTPTPTAVPEGFPTPTPTPGLRTRAETLAEIQTLRSRIVDEGEDFAEIAAEYSDDQSNAATGGDLGWFGSGQMVPAFEDAAFALEPGVVSEPISTTFGYHLIEVLERDENRPKDQSQLAQERNQAFSAWLQERVAATEIERPSDIESKLPPSIRNVNNQAPVPQPQQPQPQSNPLQ